jgi:NADPH-dependent 2,4-dienoyl-CoA reductase/sulfur reductase-like enzyme
MFPNRLLVIGGVAAGLSAASRARKVDPRLDITVLEQGRHISYSTCGLPYLVGGHVRRTEELLVYSAQFFREKRGIEVLTGMRALEIEPGRRRVRAQSVETKQERTFLFDRLVIATGSRPDWPAIPGLNLPGVFQGNNLEGALAVRAFIESHRPRRAAILGGGYIGLEYAEALRGLGLQVTVYHSGAELLDGFDHDMTERVEETLVRHGVQVLKGTRATAVLGEARVREVASAAGRCEADLVLVATGVVPAAELAVAAGIATGVAGAIAVDERMQTSLPGVYAAGDCAHTTHLVTGRPAYIPLGTTANKQGRVAGENAAGGHARLEGVVGTAVTRVFEMECARTGLSEQEAQAAGFRVVSEAIEHHNRAPYFGSKKMRVKLVADRATGRLLGAQLVGEEGVAKRVDVLATALHARMTIEQLTALDLSYAPPFAPVWDPVLIAANAMARRLRGER